MTLKEIKTLLEKYNLRPQKKFGQNFLFENGIIKKILDAAQIEKSDIVLEIGPGVGNLTQQILRQVSKVTAVEKDREMVSLLKKELCQYPGIEIIQEDILKFNLLSLPQNYKVIANLPFYLTAPIIRKLLESKNQPKDMVLIIQKEVAQRICSRPPEMNLLAASVQFYADAKTLFYISKKNFWPEPKIDCAAISIRPFVKRPDPQIARIFFEIARAGFSQPRKQLANNFSNQLKIGRAQAESWLLKHAIDPKRRAQTLSMEEWIKLTNDWIAKPTA